MSAARVRPARDNDAAAICDLYTRTFGRTLAPAAWRWKYADHLGATGHGKLPTVWVAVDESDRPISHYGGVPRQLRLPGHRTATAMVAMDGMTDARHRRRGLYTRTLEVAHQAWRQAGVACVLGLPNEQLGSRIEALDWRLLFPLRWRLRALHPEALLARRLGWPSLARWQWKGRLLNRLADLALRGGEDLDINVESKATGRFDRLDPPPEPGSARLCRGSAWAQWRYASCPLHDYELLVASSHGIDRGYLAWRIDHAGSLPFGLVAEWHGTDEGARRALLWAALVSMRRAGAVAAGVLAVPGRPEDRLLRRAGFWFGWGAFDLRCVPLADDLPVDVLRDPTRFTVAGGDFDVV